MVYNRQRLADLEDLLELQYEKLGEFEKDLALNASTPAKFELKQRIKREVLPDIRRYEQEYWELYPMEDFVIPEDEAASQLVQVGQAVTSLEQGSFAEYPPGMFALLQEIRARLDGLERSASAKLKVAIPLIPAIASYELEMDTEGVMYKTWKPLRGLIRRLHPTFFRK